MGDSKIRKIDFVSGGWVLIGASLLVVAAIVWRVSAWPRVNGGAVGDGSNVSSYGFDLGSIDPRLNLDSLVAAGIPKEGIPALVNPPQMTPAELLSFNEEHRGKYLLPDDVVIGVAMGDEARAYPLRTLNWHEIVNDRIADTPIAVTYNPLADCALVYDRRVGAEELEFGVSGLLYSSNLLMFDRRPTAADESLWLQLAGRAVAGPAYRESRKLRLLQSSVVRWGDWLKTNPNTTVLRPEESKFKRYKSNPYGHYRITGKLRFPVEPAPPGDGPPLLRNFAVVDYRDLREVVAIEDSIAPHTLDLTPKGIPAALRVLPAGERMTVELLPASDDPEASLVTLRTAAWFAVYSQFIGTDLSR